MKSTEKLIEKILSEVALDPRIESGIFEIHNLEHRDILAEHMESMGIPSDAVNEMLDELAMEEGKYPDRQAFNKEGWLVTFPSKEYRDAAIKKGTHSVSDPTHGKGGMNLYYKRKGKQKRQRAQDTSRVGGEEPQGKPKQPAPVTTQPKPTKAGGAEQDPSKSSSSKSTTAPDEEEEYYDDVSPASMAADDEKLSKAFGWDKKPKSEPSAAPSSADAPAIDVPVVSTPPVKYAEVSEKFSKQKGWTKTEYGEYRDTEGNPVAVVGLTGEVVPIRNNDREEYKIFAEKQMPA